MKFSFGENPKSVHSEKDRMPSTRMGTAAVIREALFSAREYMNKVSEANTPLGEKPDFDMSYEALIPVLKREIPVFAHAHRADDIFTAIRISKEFDLKTVIVHATEAHLIKDELKDQGYPLLLGPIMTDRSKVELKNQTESIAKQICEQNIQFALITDHPETPEKFLPVCAAISVKHGLEFYEALKATTIYPARICGIDNRIGSIEPKKDSDIVIWNSSPFDIMSSPYKIIV